MSAPEEAVSSPYAGHTWPENVYEEVMDMGILAEWVYTFGYIVDAARASKDFVGLNVDENNTQISKADIPDEDRTLKRTFTPSEVKKLIQDNVEILSKYGQSSDFRGKKLTRLYADLDKISARTESSDEERPLVLEEFDDKFQTKEPVYGVCTDDMEKRITVVFRGTDALGLTSNWKTNLNFPKVKGIIPELLKEELGEKDIKFHRGFYKYLFNKTKLQDDAEETTKFDQISTDVKALLAQNPGYKVYVSGHSLGAAVSTICAWYLSADPEIPGPVSNINFASPRVGDKDFLEATAHLEKTGRLRILRVVNDNDTVTVVPSTGYHHVGFQIVSYAPGWFGKQAEPKLDYPNLKGKAWAKLCRGWKNSFFASVNIGYDHGMRTYLERIEVSKKFFEGLSLNALYMDEDKVGFNVSSA